MADTVEERLFALEELMTDLPEILNLRSERTDATLSEFSARLSLIDRQIATLTRDVRDIRAGVTRQLIAQDEVIKILKERMDGSDQRLQRLEERVAGLDGRVAGLDQKFDAFANETRGRFDQIVGMLHELQSRS